MATLYSVTLSHPRKGLERVVAAINAHTARGAEAEALRRWPGRQVATPATPVHR